MSQFSRERFFDLLPGIYRHLDQDKGHPLRAYLSVLEQVYHDIEGDMERLYENWFIETCQPWVIPYIGDLVGVRGVNDSKQIIPGMRSRVAYALRYDRSKGTHMSMERIVRDVTGWGARVVENFQMVAATQHVRSIQPNRKTLAIRDADQLSWLGNPFGTIAQGADVRHGDSGDDGRYRLTGKQNFNASGINLFLWRLQSYPIRQVEIGKCKQEKDLYTFSPLGWDMPLFKFPVPWQDPEREADIGTIAGPLVRLPMENAGEAYRADLAKGRVFDEETLARRAHFQIFQNGKPIEDQHILICDLARRDPAFFEPRTYPIGKKGESKTFPIHVAVDPVRGRLAFPDDHDEKKVRVLADYTYGFSGNSGGGPYERRESLTKPGEDTWIGVVSKNFDKDETGRRFRSLSKALSDWQSEKTGKGRGTVKKGLIRILDNGTYEPGIPEIRLDNHDELIIEAANGSRPCIRGNPIIRVGGENNGFTLNGIVLDGQVEVESHKPSGLRMNIIHCTLAPLSGRESILATQGNYALSLDLRIYWSITGTISLFSGTSVLWVENSIVDGSKDGQAITGEGKGLQRATPFVIGSFQKSTILGEVFLRELHQATDTLFVAPILVKQRQLGSLRYCYYAEGSKIPRTYKCQTPAGEEGSTVKSARPIFTSLFFGDAGFGQLAWNCPATILRGAESGSEIGAFNHLNHVQRLANLQVLEDFAPYGLEFDIHFVT